MVCDPNAGVQALDATSRFLGFLALCRVVDYVRASDDLHRSVRRPRSPGLGPGSGLLPAESPAISPAPRPWKSGLGRGRPPHPPLDPGSPPAHDVRGPAPAVPERL